MSGSLLHVMLEECDEGRFLKIITVFFVMLKQEFAASNVALQILEKYRVLFHVEVDKPPP